MKTRTITIERSDGAFLGRGWQFPPRFHSAGAEVEMVAGPQDIHQSLQILLTTRLGERVMQDKFGCALEGLLFEEMDQSLVNRITAAITDSILYHETRIKLDGVRVDESADERGLLMIHIAYTVKTTNSRFNMVFPFYLNEANKPL
jgi:phage baseplate assembly protein W